ncbi:uncharacterized protein LOC127869107 isoform X2 [Dreissena polymorpha]|nr:uncharacterized protein LOC127869107 isoform X2 [Dreissena polymorpha]
MRSPVWICLWLAQATLLALNKNDKQLPQTTTVAKAYVDIECLAEEDSYIYTFVKIDTTESRIIAECEPDVKSCYLVQPSKDNLTYTVRKTYLGWSLRVHKISEDVYGTYQCITSGNVPPQSLGSTTTASQSTGETTTLRPNDVILQESRDHGDNNYPFLVALLFISGYIAIVVSFPYAKDHFKKIRGKEQTRPTEERPLLRERQTRSTEERPVLRERQTDIHSDADITTLHEDAFDMNNLSYHRDANQAETLIVVSGESIVTPPIVPIVPRATSATVQIEHNLFNEG